MAMSVLNFGRIRDLISNLGWRENNNAYTLGAECLEALKSIEDELLHADAINRNVHICLHICGTVKKDLIPVLLNGKNSKILAVAIRVLVNLSLPVECLSPVEGAFQIKKVQKQLLSASLEIKKAFLNEASTFSIVSILREAMINSEKHNLPLTEDDCFHLKNCLILLQNLLHIPEESTLTEDSCNLQSWQYIQNKLIWNLFVQGVDGALLLMLNSKYKAQWTVPISFIIALLYRNQNVTKIHEAIELISSASDTSGDEEESDGSKNSSTSLSSEPSKTNKELSDSGCVLTSDTSAACDGNSSKTEEVTCQNSLQNCFPFDIYSKLERVQISDDSEPQRNLKNVSNHFHHSFMSRETDSGSSSCSDLPQHKKFKGSTSLKQVFMSEGMNYSSKEDSGVAENLSCNMDIQTKSLNEADKKSVKNFKAVQKLRSLQMHARVLESDSSNEETHHIKIKYRNHPPVCRRGKSPRRNNGCTPSVCMDSAISDSILKGRMKYPLWEKRNSVTTLVDNSSTAPSDEEIGHLMKEFTISFIHSGFSHLIEDLKNLLVTSSSVTIDKSLLFWILSYFLHLSATVHLNLDHISNILNPDIIGYLTYECVLACENLEMHSEADMKIKKYLFDHLNLVVTSLKEVLVTIDAYARKSTSQKDKAFFSILYGKLADFEHLRQMPLLLFQNCQQVNSMSFTEAVVILNHYILNIMEKGREQYPMSQKFNIVHHLKHFSSQSIMNSYGLLLGNYKYNSNILNECLFTMMHHIAGDVHASDSLIEPSILKSFSSILKEDIELEPYQEDLVMYILNKFSLQIQKSHLKNSNEEGEHSYSSAHSSNGSSSVNWLLSDEDDDLFWWYLQFEQDKDPIARISEHIPLSKQDILAKLQVKGIVTPESYKCLEEKMDTIVDGSSDLLSCEGLIEMENFDDEITHLLRTLVQSGWRQQLTWIQDALLETCYVKLGLNDNFSEPIPYHSLKIMTSVPLVPYTKEQRLILLDQTFLKLLQKIGFLLGTSMCPTYPRIPLYWTTHVLFTIACRLGPLRKDNLKFSYNDLLLAEPNYDELSMVPPYQSLPPLSSCCTLSSWLAAVQKSKEEQKSAVIS